MTDKSPPSQVAALNLTKQLSLESRTLLDFDSLKEEEERNPNLKQKKVFTAVATRILPLSRRSRFWRSSTGGTWWSQTWVGLTSGSACADGSLAESAGQD